MTLRGYRSLLPGEPVLEERRRWLRLCRTDGLKISITMAYPVIESSRRVAFLGSQVPATRGESGNRILDCSLGPIADPARLEQRIHRTVGVVEHGLFIFRAHPLFIADAGSVHCPDSARAHRGGPPILVIIVVSGVGKSTVAEELAARLGWPFEDGGALHPEVNRAKMHGGIPLAYADRQAWLERVATSIDDQRAKKQPGIIVCLALKRSYRQIIAGNWLVGLRGGRDLIAAHLAGRNHPFVAASLMQSQIDALEEPDPGEDPLTADMGPPAGRIAQKITRLPRTSAKIDESATPAWSQ